MDEYLYPVEVEGDWASINPKTLQNKVQIYFQSKKKSQGGDCLLQWSERCATVYFKSESTQQNVLAKEDHAINVDHQDVKLKVSKPSADGPGQKEESESSAGAGNDVKSGVQQTAGLDESQNDAPPKPSAVALQKLPSNFNREYLTLLVDSVCNVCEEEFFLEFFPELRTAVVTFNDSKVAEKFLAEIRTKKKLQDCGLAARALDRSWSVKVENLPVQCNSDWIDLYFDKWGEIERVVTIPDEQAAIVTFKEQDAVENVLGKQHHIQNTLVSVYAYYDSLGTALYGKNRPAFTLPKPFTKKIHPSTIEFLHKKGKVQSISNQMASHFCRVNLDKENVLLSPLPSLLKQQDLNKKQVDGWKQTTINAFENILSNFSLFEYSLTPPLWSEVEKDIRSTVKDKAVLNMDALAGCLTLAGMAQDINMLRPILESFLNKASIQMERENQKTKESMSTTPAMFFLLQQEGLTKDAAAKYPQLELTYKKDTSQVMLVGLPLEILHVKNWMLERLFNMKHKTLKMDASLLDFLRSVELEEISRDLFTSKNISAVCTFENGDLVLSGSTQQSLTDANNKIEMMLTFQSLSLEDVGVLEKPEWQVLTGQLCDTNNTSRKKTVKINFSRHRNEVIVCGFREPVLEISKSLEEFITTHTRIDKSIRVRSYAVVKFMKDKKSQDWQNLVWANQVKVHFDPKRPLIRVSGERVHVQSAREFFQITAKALCTDKMTIEKPGAKKYFQEQGSMALMMIKDSRFVVVLDEGLIEEEVEDEDDQDSGSGVKDFKSHLCEYRTPGGVTISVRKADICQLKVDAVVNAANEDLKHIGGLALALLNAAGRSLQECCDRFIAVNGKLQPGQAVLTEPGRLPCKYVVHAVGPRFSDYDESNSVRILRLAVQESLNQAASNDCTSIAVPAISSGIFGFPLDLCTETIAKELREYTRRHQGGKNSLKEIHLVDNNPNTVNAMEKALKKEFGDLNPRTTFPKQTGAYERGASYRGEQSQAQGYRQHGDRGGRAEGSDRQNINSQPRTRHADWPKSKVLETQSTKEGIKIILREGNIQDALSDVIVNTVSESLDLSHGAVSSALLQAAGPQIQSEAYSNMPSSSSSKQSNGDMVVTDGYNLSCRKVFHVVCPHWNGGTGSEDEVLKGIIQECLKTAEKQKMSSITFPAIGTGNLNFPKDLVSKDLLKEVHAFSAKVSPQYLNEVTVIVHPSDNETVQCFTKSFRGGWQVPIAAGAQAIQQPLAKKAPTAKPSQSPGLFGQVSTPTLGVHQVQVGHLMLEVSSGDITKEKCDVIVNVSNQQFSLKSGVSKAILDGAGPSVEQECAQMVASSQIQNYMILTSAGQLLCKNIIHVVGRSNPAEIKDVVYSVLKLCEEQKFTSVAFPALGTGRGGASPAAVADVMIDAVVEFVKKKRGVKLQNVKFLIFQTVMVPDFYQSMLKKQQEGVEEQSGIMSWIKGKFDTMTSLLFSDSAGAPANKDFVFVSHEFDPVIFQLCGESEQDLGEAKNWLKSIIMKEYISSNIQDSAINSFGQDESDVLREMQRELSVSIRLAKKGPEPEIILDGLTRDVMKAESCIRDMIRKVEKKAARQRSAFMLSSQIEWQYQDASKIFVPVDILTNFDLEEAFRLQNSNLPIVINNEAYNANLTQNVAVGKNGKIKLKRTEIKEHDSVSLPNHWEDMKGKLVLRVLLKQGTKEYTDVEKEFTKTGLLASTILQIERIQNDTLWKNYMNEMAYLDKKNKHTNNEKLLFHGTGPDSIDKINERGFNRSYAGTQVGAMYGNGVYFAVDPCYSAQGYARADHLGHKRMYFCRVLVGDFTVGRKGLLAPPARSAASTDLYDSLTDNQQNPSMYVIFHDAHAYPEYIITFT